MLLSDSVPWFRNVFLVRWTITTERSNAHIVLWCLWFDSRYGWEIFLLYATSVSVLGPTVVLSFTLFRECHVRAKAAGAWYWLTELLCFMQKTRHLLFSECMWMYVGQYYKLPLDVTDKRDFSRINRRYELRFYSVYLLNLHRFELTLCWN
jgi:hypothetical protein